MYGGIVFIFYAMLNYMKKITMIAVLGAFVFAGVFNFASPALAVPGDSISGTEVGLEGEPFGITAADLGVSNVGILPTSRLYLFKEWRRGAQRLFTFNPIKKAELELNITNVIAAEVIEVEKSKPDDTKAIVKALENYTKSQERLKAQLAKLTKNSENPNLAKLLEKVDEKTTKHITFFVKLSSGFRITKASDDAPGLGMSSNLDSAQNSLREAMAVSVDKGENAKQRAEDQIVRAEEALSTVKKSGLKIISNRVTKTAELAKDHLDLAKKAFTEDKYGEAFGQARSAEVIAKDALRVMIQATKSDFGDKAIIQTAEGSASAIGNLIKRMRELAKQTPSATMSSEERNFVITLFYPTEERPSTSLRPTFEWRAEKLKEGVSFSLVLREIPKEGDPESGRIVMERKGIRENSLRFPADAPPLDDSTKVYTWKVTAVSKDGRVLATSRMGSFTQPKPRSIPENSVESRTPTPQKTEPMFCSAQYDPVCGADGRTYGNSCEAGLARVTVNYAGICGDRTQR